MTADLNDGAADALDRQIARALADGYFQEAVRLASDSLALRIEAVEEEPLRFRQLSTTLDLTARIVHESGLALPANFEKAVETYHAATISCLKAEDRLEHAIVIVTMAEEIVVAGRYVESIAACRAARVVLNEHATPDQLGLSLPGQVRAASVMCVAFHMQNDTDSLMRLYQERDDFIRKCAELGIKASEDIITRLPKRGAAR